MPTLPSPSVSDRPPSPGPDATPEWRAELEYWAAERGLPPEPWPA